MADIKAIFTFLLANGEDHKITVNDLADNLDEAKLIALGNKMVTLGGAHKGSNYVSLKACERVTTSKEKFDL